MPFSAHEQNAADVAFVLLQKLLKMLCGQFVSNTFIPKIRGMTSRAGQWAARDMKA